MSLVGSLEDLGLGDILQIVSLSRKSGLLLLRSEEGEGRIVFCDGLVRAGFVKGEAEDLRGLLVAGGFIGEEEFDAIAETAEAHGDPVAEVLAKSPGFSKERLDSLRREQVERSAFRMFGWKSGEFSFEIRDDIDERDRELLLPTGINAQYLTMEATRLGDEGAKDGDDDIQFGTIDESTADEAAEVPESGPGWELPDFPADADPNDTAGYGPPLVVPPEIGSCRAAETLAMAALKRVESLPSDDEIATGDDAAAEPADEPLAVGEVVAVEPGAEAPVELEQPPDEDPVTGECAGAVAPNDAAHEESEVAAVAKPAAWESADVAEGAPCPDFASLVIIDPDLTALEWQKSVLGPICRRVHIFQRSDGGISRIRQYLRRGEEPLVLVSSNVPRDPMSGISDPLGLIRRLRAHAPRMPIFFVQSGDRPPPRDIGEANGLLPRPADHQLANRRAWSKLESAGVLFRDKLRSGVAFAKPRAAVATAPPAASGDSNSASDLRRLKQMSDRLRDPSARGEVLSLILEFAAEFFSRVAIFMVRDDDAVGMAQSGLARADGPDDDTFRDTSISVAEPAWFRSVLECREGLKGPPRNDGDQNLAALLGSEVPREAYVAPIESSQHVVALVYADNLPGGEPIGDTTSLEIVLHEAGLALERALLERALADTTGSGGV
jgi:hypothetical protein